ncbi:MAG: TlpA family protein disulfide reductase [Clostridia bacterium]|nr:TlpA family protein disulfide reductase [Clostridia bacterium]
MKKLVATIMCLTMVLAFASCSQATIKKDTKTTKAIEKVNDDKKDTDETVKDSEESSGDKVSFSTTDRDGNSFNDSLFADHDLTLINFWEPWCGPCVNEIPDLQKLYDNYADLDLLVIGVYSEEGMEEDVDTILSDNSVTYPILKYTSDFDKYQSGYVPTTILVDRQGNIIDTENNGTLIVGSHSYSDWEDIVTPYLGE